ncbi:MAG: EAL domain-containing protein [Burkholderiales bacterium]|nr:EAL domain-containing protein [Burkholderiales bacterium]
MTNLKRLFDYQDGKPLAAAVPRQSEFVAAMRLVLGQAANAALLTDRKGALAYLNRAAEDLLGVSSADAQGRQFADLLKLATLDKRKTVELPVAAVLSDGRTVEFPSYATMRASDGRLIAVQGSVSPVFNEAGRTAGALIQLFDVSRLGTIADQLEDPAAEDYLTGLVTRQEFEKRVERALRRASAQKVNHILCYVGLERFRRISETFGAKFADEVLQGVTFTLRARTRERDTIARLRGDEFAVLLESCTLADGLKIADELLEALGALNFKIGSETVKVGASIGLAQIDHTSEHFSDVLAETDVACDRARQNGNRVEVFGEDDLESTREKQDEKNAAGFAKAMEENRFELFLQPIQPLKAGDGRFEFFEVFTKMKTIAGEMVGPSYFISDAERHHVMPVLDRHIVSLAFEAYREIYGEGAANNPVVWAINISGTSLRDGDFIEFIRQKSRALEVPPQAICFDIAETTALSRSSRAVQFIRSLKADGFRFSVDDFGPAMGSFAVLKALGIDYVKIDGAVVSEISRDRVSRGTVKAIQYLCNIIGVKTIAESAESDEIVEMLRECRVNFAQGYALGAPISLAAYRKLGLLSVAS